MKWLPIGELLRVHFFGAVEAECQWQLVRPQHHLLGPPVRLMLTIRLATVVSMPLVLGEATEILKQSSNKCPPPPPLGGRERAVHYNRHACAAQLPITIYLHCTPCIIIVIAVARQTRAHAETSIPQPRRCAGSMYVQVGQQLPPAVLRHGGEAYGQAACVGAHVVDHDPAAQIEPYYEEQQRNEGQHCACNNPLH